MKHLVFATTFALAAASGTLLGFVDTASGVMITLPDRNPYADVIVTGPMTFHISPIQVEGDYYFLYWADFQWNENTFEFEVADYGQLGSTSSFGCPAAETEIQLPSTPSTSIEPQGVPIDLTKSTLEITGNTTLHFSRIAARESSYHADFGWNEFRNVFQITDYVEDRPVPMEMILISAGKFNMGAPDDEPYGPDEKPVHEVWLTRSFYLSATEVTQAQWDEVMLTNPSEFNRECGNNCAQDFVSWDLAITYCNARSAREGLERAYDTSGPSVIWDPGADGYRLPTEAEWEYACRATTTSAFYSGAIIYPYYCDPVDPNLVDIAWYCGNEANSGKPYAKLVGQKYPNLWGLYDMSGNVMEWVWDFWGPYPIEEVFDPTGPTEGPGRVLRGGYYSQSPNRLRSATRTYTGPGNSSGWDGFRVARSME